MRSAPLTTIKGGIDRQRLQGGARADVLYDLVNGYQTDAGTVVSRPGTRRIATVPTGTKGLCAFGGELYVFSNVAAYVPSPLRLVILVHPDISAENVPATIELTAAKYEETPVYNVHIGAETYGDLSGTNFGSVSPEQCPNGMGVVALFTNGGDPLASTLTLWLADVNGNAANPDTFVSFSFVDTHGITREFNTYDADVPDGTPQTGYREWTWTLPDDPAEVFTPGGTYTITFDETTSADTTIEGDTIALSKIHSAEPFMGALYVVAEFENGNVYHYWLQEGEQWQANHVYKLGDLVYPEVSTGIVYRATRLGSANPPWEANVPRYDGSFGSGYDISVIEPTVYNDYYYTCIATTGSNPRSGETEPDWPTVDGATVIESTDNPPDVNIPATVEASVSTPSSSTTTRYGTFKGSRQVIR